VLFFDIDKRIPKQPESKHPASIDETVVADPANVEAGLPQGKSSAVLSEEFAILAWPVLQLTGLLQDVRGRICQRRSPRRASLCFVRPLAPALQSASNW
jgi:hypothetical protein